MNLRRFFSWLLCICFMLLPIHSLAWANTGYSTPSNASIATASNAEYEELYNNLYNNLLSYSSVPLASASDADYGIMLLSTGDTQDYTSIWSMDNTVDANYVTVQPVYYDSAGNMKTGASVQVKEAVTSDGKSILCVDPGMFIVPDDFASLRHYNVKLFKGSMPDPGVYSTTFACCVTELSGLDADLGLYSRKSVDNANMLQDYVGLDSYTSLGSMITYSFVLDLGSVDYLEFRIYPTNWKEYYFPSWFRVSVVFDKLSSSASSDVTTAGGAYTSDDAAADTAQNTAQIAQNTADVNDTLKEIITHISDQLAALWDQMYNLMHVPQLANDDKNTGLITDSIETQMENDNENTDQVTTAIEDHGNFIIEGLKSLFIPSDEYFKSWFDDMYAFFNDRLGFLMLPADVLIEFIDIFTSSSEEFAGIPFPEFKWIDGTVVIPAQTVGFDFLNSDWGKELQNKLYFVGNVIMIGSLFALIQRKLKEVTEQ